MPSGRLRQKLFRPAEGEAAGSDGPANPGTAVPRQDGDARVGRDVFRFETFGNERFWTDAVRLPEGMMVANVTPLKALRLGVSVDDKMAVVNASLRGDIRGTALPLLLDLGRKLVFLHDNTVPSLDNLLDPTRGPAAPHPFYLADAGRRADMIAFLRGLDTKQ